MTVPYQKVFSRKASPFMRWVLSPFLLLFATIFFIPLFKAVDEQRFGGMIATSLVILVCVAGFLALWGVPFVGRIVAGIIALIYGWYLVDQCIIDFDGSWGWGERRSKATPINSILGFFVFGLPCFIYTIFGRFSLKKEPEIESDSDDEYGDFEDDDIRNEYDDEQHSSSEGDKPPM